MRVDPSATGKRRTRKKNTEGEDGSVKSDNGDMLWFEDLDPFEIVDHLPIIINNRGQKERIQMPLHESTETMATKIREKYPQKFRINLDVYRSMLYAGRQLFEYVYLRDDKVVRNSRGYQMAKMIDEVDQATYDKVFVDEMLKKLMEGYLAHGQGKFSRDNIIAQVEDMKVLIPADLQARCDNFIDEELDSEDIKRRVSERLRKREYRDKKSKLRLVGASE